MLPCHLYTSSCSSSSSNEDFHTFNGLGILMAARCDVVETGRCIGMFGRNEGQGWGSEGLMEGRSA